MNNFTNGHEADLDLAQIRLKESKILTNYEIERNNLPSISYKTFYETSAKYP